MVLLFVGIVQIAQPGKMRRDVLSAWHLGLRLLAAIGGGILVYLDPFAGIMTITVLMAIVFAVRGLTQMSFAAKIRRLVGWHWLAVAGCVARLAAAVIGRRPKRTRNNRVLGRTEQSGDDAPIKCLEAKPKIGACR